MKSKPSENPTSQNDERGDRVGYKNPPKRARFKKGKSGNPAGRPKGSRSFMSLLAQALNERVTISEGGCRTQITKREALAKQIANKGAAGDLKVAMMLLGLLKQIDDHDCAPRIEDGHHTGKSAREFIAEKLRSYAEANALASLRRKAAGPET